MRYLVVANQTLGGEELLDALREKMAAGDASFHVVVPATQPLEGMVFSEADAKRLAQERLEAGLERFRRLGAEVDGEVGGEDPLGAMSDALRDHGFDEIILATLPAGLSKWLKTDLPSRVERAFELPVTHVISHPRDEE